jgi:hypothetical protein
MLRFFADNLNNEVKRNIQYRWRLQQVSKTIDRPFNSSDDNPIDNLRSIVESHVKTHRSCNNIDALARFV